MEARMKVACGNYINVYSEIGYEDEEDISNVKLDIVVCFAEFLHGSIDYASAEERIRKVIAKYKDSMGEFITRFTAEAICDDLQQLIADEFLDEAIYVNVRYYI